MCTGIQAALRLLRVAGTVEALDLGHNRPAELRILALAKQKMTLREFLVWEDLQPERHEFYNGEVFAMVGGRRIHKCVIGNLAFRLRGLLEGSACQVFAAGMTLQLADDTVHCPDVLVT